MVSCCELVFIDHSFFVVSSLLHSRLLVYMSASKVWGLSLFLCGFLQQPQNMLARLIEDLPIGVNVSLNVFFGGTKCAL